jgi:hypothetical protein
MSVLDIVEEEHAIFILSREIGFEIRLIFSLGVGGVTKCTFVKGSNTLTSRRLVDEQIL